MLQRRPNGLRRSIKVPHHSDRHPSRTTTTAEGPPAPAQSPLTLHPDCPARHSLPFLELSPNSGTVLLCPSHHVTLFSPSTSEALPQQVSSPHLCPLKVPPSPAMAPQSVPRSLSSLPVRTQTPSPLSPSSARRSSSASLPEPPCSEAPPWVT